MHILLIHQIFVTPEEGGGTRQGKSAPHKSIDRRTDFANSGAVSIDAQVIGHGPLSARNPIVNRRVEDNRLARLVSSN